MAKISLGFQTPFMIQFSLEHAIRRLELIEENPNAVHEPSDRSLLETLRDFPELRDGIYDTDIFQQQAPLIARLMAAYFPPELTHNEIKAIGLPFMSFAFNPTVRFMGILSQAGKSFEFNIRNFDEHQMYVLSCCIVLNELYSTKLDFGKPLFYDIPTAQGIIKHYRILYNADFLDVLPTKDAVEIGLKDIELLRDSYDDLELWKRMFPPESYILKGFLIMTLFDATVENAVSTFKGNLLGFNSIQFQQSLSSIFSSIFGIADLKVGYVLFSHEDTASGEPIVAISAHSLLLTLNEKIACGRLTLKEYWPLVNKMGYLTISDVARRSLSNPGDAIGRACLANGINSVILAPVIREGKFLGSLEITSPRINELNSVSAHKLEVVMPHLSDHFYRMAGEMENSIQAVIQNRFTSLHPSVNWRFRQIARRQIDVMGSALGSDESDDVLFEGLVPMYAQVDVMGSSEARNTSVIKDLKAQLGAALSLLGVADRLAIAGAASFSDEINELLGSLDHSFQTSAEHRVNVLLMKKLNPWLSDIRERQMRGRLHAYFSSSDKTSGKFHTYRRKYEQTIAMINQVLVDVLDRGQLAAQSIFPHYYERFKSDGIEHNLYLGQAINPSGDYDFSKLAELRLWQLKTVIQMETAHHDIAHLLPLKLQVTSLVLVYNPEIAIRFRMDEKRFDVDGTYNARYEMVKKRIDKAQVLSTGKRIVQPGKVTIVFTSETEIQEYLEYLGILQGEKLIGPRIERFAIQDLQGLSGMIGLRVAVRRA